MNSNIVPNSFVAISDFHSYRYPLDKVKKYYLNEYDKIFILGDATDRGEDHKGTQGIEILEEIMKLSKKYPQRVIYVPGNHDELLYNYAKSGDPFYEINLQSNGGANTVKEINRMKDTEPERLEELIDWLGNQPLQREHYYDGTRFVFAHAFFNQRIYDQNPSFALKNLYRLKFRTDEYNKPGNILWFRKGQYDNPEEISTSEVPTNAIMVIGHTPVYYRYGLDLSLENKNGEMTPVFCVDGGISYGDEMLKFDGQSTPVHTEFYVHHDTSPKPESRLSIEDREEAIKIMNEASIETASKHDIYQVKYALTELISGVEDWANCFSGDNRYRIYGLGEETIKQILLDFSGKENDLRAGIDRYLDGLFEYQKEPKTTTAFDSLGTTQEYPKIDEEYLKAENSSREPQTYGLTKDQIIQDDLRPSRRSNSREPQTYGLTKNQIIQDDLRPKTYRKK